MFNVCPGCGEYSDDKEIDPIEAVAVCRSCGHRHGFGKLPLFVVTGASGTGKTTVALALPKLLPECVCLDSDILWRDEFNQPDNDYAEFRNLWLRMAKNISQSGRPVVLFGSSTPGQFEKCPERRYLADLKYLALIVAEDELELRLKSRPGWRKSGNADVVASMQRFNSWLIANAASSGLDLLDTTNISVEDAARSVADWVRKSAATTQH